MTWKKSSLKLFNAAYFQLLMKRHLWLIYVPLGVYFSFLFLFLVLNIDTDILSIFVFPYAAIAVPMTSLLLFRFYTKKSEASHILSIPMTRIEHFLTTFLAGLCLVLIPILILACCISALDMNRVFGYSDTTFILSMFLLGVIYYSFSTFGCMLGGTLLTQLMMMAVVSFGPLMLYLLINLCVDSLAFGNLNSNMNSSLVAMLCPLYAGIEFMNTATWPMFPFHVVEVVALVGMSIYLAKIRPIELSGQSVIFKNVQNFLLKPLFYLNIVFIIFCFCSVMVFQDTDFGPKYYVKLVLLLAGTGFIVAFIMNVWFSHDMKSLFQAPAMIQTVLLTLVSCFFFFVPLWQKEKSRELDPKGPVSIAINYNGLGGYLHDDFNTDDPLNHERISEILHYIDEHRELFVKGRWNGIEEACEIRFLFEGNYTINQSYYIYPKNLDGILGGLVNELFLNSRNEQVEYLKAGNGIYYQDNNHGTVYEIQSYVEAIQSTFIELPTDFMINPSNSSNFYYENDYSNFGQNFYEKYQASLNADSYEQWQQEIDSKANIVLNKDTWQEIVTCLDSLENLPISHWMGTSTLSQYQQLLLKHVEVDGWKFKEINEHRILASIPMNLYVLEEMQMNNHHFFENEESNIVFEVELSKVNGQWQMKIIEMVEVNY